MTLPTLLFLGGICHFGILIGSACVPQVLDWRNELGRVSKLLRQLVWVHGAFIVLTIIGFGALTLIASHELASGTRLARAMCTFIAIFWLIRLVLQFTYFDATPHLTNPLIKIGYHSLTVVFIFLVGVYGWAAIFCRPICAP